MAPSSSRNGAARSSQRIRVLTNRQVTARFLNPLTGHRPRTRAEKAALDDAPGPRAGNLLDHFMITKHGPNQGKLEDTGSKHDDMSNRTPSTVDEEVDDGDTSMSASQNSSEREVQGGGKRKAEAAKRKAPAKKRRPNAASRTQAPSARSHGGNGGPDWITPALQVCWPDIFRHAASDSDGTGQGWLLQAATICKALAEPAITVLYENPKIMSDRKMQKFIATLELPETLFYYREKVHSLHLGPEFLPRVPALKALILCLPRLKHFSVTHELDQPPYRDWETVVQKTDPKFWNLLDERKDTRPGMIQTPRRMLSWKWSGRFLPDFLADSRDIMHLHTSGPLKDVKRLHLTDFPHRFYIAENSPAWSETVSQVTPTLDQGLLDGEVDADNADNAENVVMTRCAQTINSLDRLEDLVLEACAFVEGPFWPLMTRRLKHLEITHCGYLDSEGIQRFLAPNGGNLKTLILNNNAALSLEFLVDLRRDCPHLETLVVNMSYYRSSLVSSAEPQFDQALGELQVPTWPSSLRHIELLHVRPWKPEAAATLFISLIDSASELPNLRYLVIKSMLNLDWRRRADLRADWLRRLQAVFLRPPSKPPTQIPLSKPAREAVLDADDKAADSKRTASAGPPTRRSGRIHTQHPASSRRSSRPRRTGYAEPPSDPEDDAGGESSSSASDADADIETSGGRGDDDGSFVQGLCERVELTMENHKLAEVQFDMDDFRDPSADSQEDDSDFSM